MDRWMYVCIYVCRICGQCVMGWFFFLKMLVILSSFREVRDLKDKHEQIAKFKICLAISHGKVDLGRSRELSRNMN